MSEHKPVGLKSNFFFYPTVLLGLICLVAVTFGSVFWLIFSIIDFMKSLVQ